VVSGVCRSTNGKHWKLPVGIPQPMLESRATQSRRYARSAGPGRHDRADESCPVLPLRARLPSTPWALPAAISAPGFHLMHNHHVNSVPGLPAKQSRRRGRHVVDADRHDRSDAVCHCVSWRTHWLACQTEDREVILASSASRQAAKTTNAEILACRLEPCVAPCFRGREPDSSS